MKTRIAIIFLSLLCLSVSAQKRKKVKVKLTDFTITQTKSLKKTGIQLFLKQVISDGRCPEGLDCFWAGEAQANISTYKNGKWADETIDDARSVEQVRTDLDRHFSAYSPLHDSAELLEAFFAELRQT